MLSWSCSLVDDDEIYFEISRHGIPKVIIVPNLLACAGCFGIQTFKIEGWDVSKGLSLA